MTGFQFPWERFTVAAKVGHPARLVTYNAGVNQAFLYTTHQDYWAGELLNLDTPASRPTTSSNGSMHTSGRFDQPLGYGRSSCSRTNVTARPATRGPAPATP